MGFQLYKHQEESLAKYRTQSAILNLSEAGTGKTYPTMKFIEEKGGKSVIVCPAFLTNNWKRELDKFCNIKAEIYPKTANVTICSYDRAHKATSIFLGLQVLVADEIHYLSSPKTIRTKAMHHYVKDFKPENFIGLTATPLKNRIPELWTLLTLIDYKLDRGFRKSFKSHYSFCSFFCNLVVKRYGKQTFQSFEGSKNLDQLKEHMAGISFKYFLKDLADVPDIIFETIEIETAKAASKVLDNALANAWDAVLAGGSLESASSAKKENAILKAPQTVEILQEMLSQEQRPIVVFTDHIISAEIIRDELRKLKRTSEYIRGDVTAEARDKLVQEFQAGKIDVLVGTIGAAGTGLTLTAASICIFNDVSWVPSSNYQAYSRIHRISQKSKCRVIYLVRKGIDTLIQKTLESKEKLIQEVQFT